jgi:hypothetical protein
MNPRYKVVQTELFDQVPYKVNRFDDTFFHESGSSRVQNLVVNQFELSSTQMQEYCYNFKYFRENSFLQRPFSARELSFHLDKGAAQVIEPTHSDSIA